jgi:hypothetical protein
MKFRPRRIPAVSRTDAKLAKQTPYLPNLRAFAPSRETNGRPAQWRDWKRRNRSGLPTAQPDLAKRVAARAFAAARKSDSDKLVKQATLLSERMQLVTEEERARLRIRERGVSPPAGAEGQERGTTTRQIIEVATHQGQGNTNLR